ncbi:putative membrane protein [Algoriphagus boseongensis]|uniref:Putative membrane protein n=1 Tax=Algoriphagus boseongensis TaxID=1442587 RepID=A0A4R6T7I8_9BACT|nr:DUF502 domain-containing protein [Algoriphagus boseongensis]TDQ19148.1 putative membrane protein [Algoriphagus boseongensis]
MKVLLTLFTQTVKGGVFFLLPLVLILVLLKKAVEIIMPLSHWVNEIIPFELPFSAFTLSIILLVFLCFIAGWLAKKGIGKKMILWLEDNLLTLFPGYQLMKSTYAAKVGVGMDHEFPVVLVPIDGWMFGFLVEEINEKEVLIFVPSAPSPWEGNLVIFEKNNIKPSRLKPSDVVTILKRLGVDSKSMIEKA